MSIRVWPALTLICMAPRVYAQQVSVAGPLSGFVFDGSARALRPVRGVAGAATFGDPMDAGVSLASASGSPRQDSAFAKAADGATRFFTLNGGAAAEVAIDGLGPVERVVYSPSGTAAAVYAAGGV